MNHRLISNLTKLVTASKLSCMQDTAATFYMKTETLCSMGRGIPFAYMEGIDIVLVDNILGDRQ